MAKKKVKKEDENFEKLEEEKDVKEMKKTIDEEKPPKPEKEFVEETIEEIKPKGDMLISLGQFCDSLGSEGNDKFAYVRLNATIQEKDIPEGPHSREKWEEYYLKIKNL
jgi:hypothetical protein